MRDISHTRRTEAVANAQMRAIATMSSKQCRLTRSQLPPAGPCLHIFLVQTEPSDGQEGSGEVPGGGSERRLLKAYAGSARELEDEAPSNTSTQDSTPALRLHALVPVLPSTFYVSSLAKARLHPQVRAFYLSFELAHRISSVSVAVEQNSQVQVSISRSTTAEAVRTAIGELGCSSLDNCQVNLEDTVRSAISLHTPQQRSVNACTDMASLPVVHLPTKPELSHGRLGNSR